MSKKSVRLRSLMGVNSIELERRLAVLQENKEKVIGWFAEKPLVKKHILRERLIHLFALDTGDLTAGEAARTSVKAFSAFFYAPHLYKVEDYDRISVALINVLGDHAEHFLRERGSKPQGKRVPYSRYGRSPVTGEAVPVLNGSYVEVRTAAPDQEDKYIDNYLLDEAPAQQEPESAPVQQPEVIKVSDAYTDIDTLLEELLLALNSSEDKDALLKTFKVIYPTTLDNLVIPDRLAEDLISLRPAKKFLTRLRLKAMLT